MDRVPTERAKLQTLGCWKGGKHRRSQSQVRRELFAYRRHLISATRSTTSGEVCPSRQIVSCLRMSDEFQFNSVYFDTMVNLQADDGSYE
jgi:hypothetical protein